MPRTARWLAYALCVVLAAALLPRAPMAHAATFTVTTTQDAPHTTPLDGNCTSTLPGNPCTLRAAVQAANFLRGTQAINLAAPGSYVLTMTGPDEDNAATGDLDIVGVMLSITNTSGHNLVVDGNGADRIFDMRETEAIVGLTIDGGANGIVLQHGVAPGGGAIRTGNRSASSLELRNVTISSNTAIPIGTTSGAGGGMLIGGGHVTLTNVIVADNRALGGGGDIAPGTRTNGAAGGGIAVGQFAGVTLINATVSHNLATGATSDTQSSGGSAIGGGIEVELGVLVLVNVTVSENSATGGVGPGAQGGLGGGISALFGKSGSVHIMNSTFVGNTTPLGTASGTASGLGNQILSNPQSAPAGTGPAVDVQNTIIAGSSGDNCFGLITSRGGNLASDSTCSLTAASDRSNTNPLVGPLQNNGGFAPTHALLPGSPAIDAGVDCPPPTTDERGVPRPQGRTCDIGAFELVPLSPTATPTVTNTPTITRTPSPSRTPGPSAIPSATATPTPRSVSVQQAITQVQPSGQQGKPCATQVGQTCQVSGAVQGTGTVASSMTWSLTATVSAGVAPGAVPVAVFSTAAGLQAFPCAAVMAGAATVSCIGTTAANALQGSVVSVVFGPGLVAVGTVTGPGAAVGTGGLGAVVLPLLPPPLPPLLPAPPLVAPAPVAALPAVPVIPEADPAALLGIGLLALVALSRRRPRQR